MRNGFLGSLLALTLTAGLAPAQPPDPAVLVPPGPVAEGPVVVVPNEGAGNPDRFWGSTDYLLWWLKDPKLPPLVTVGPAGSGAVLGRNGVTSVFGGSDVDSEERSGGRFTLGYWLDEGRDVGLEGSYFFLGTRAENFLAGGTGAPGTPVIGRPFANVISGLPDAELVASPGLLAGTVRVSVPSQLQGAELNGVWNLLRSEGYRVDVLGGFRFLHLGEGLDVLENLSVLPGAAPGGGNQFVVSDQFRTSNYFYGAQLGLRAEVRRGNVFASLTGKVAVGDTQEITQVAGATQISPAAGPAMTFPGGLLALPSNSGRFYHDRFAVLPEASLNLGYQVTSRLRVFAGYTFLYLSEVARPGSTVNLAVNPTRIPTSLPLPLFGPDQPLFQHRDSDFWAQGVNVGVEFRF